MSYVLRVTTHTMLETTLSTNFVPGTNLTGGLARAAWRFLLPNLALDKIVCLGVPPPATLQVLSTMAQETLVISTDARQLEAAQREIEQRAISGARMLPVKDWGQLPLADQSAGLVFLTGKNELAKRLRDGALARELNRLLDHDGVIYFEVKTFSERSAGRQMIKRLVDLGFTKSSELWMTPFSGEMRTAFPLDDDRMSKYLFTNVLYGQSVKKRAISRTGLLLSQTGLLRYIVSRWAVLMKRASTHAAPQAPPQYILALAKKSGVDLSGMRCGLSARGRFNANKNIFYLFDPAPHGAAPATKREKAKAVVKMTRAPEFNRRLENEYRVLAALQEKAFVDRDTFPQPLFFGYHADLAMLGQMAVHGEPFRRRTQATANCPVALDAINWIVQLGIASANPAPQSGACEVEAALMKLFRRFTKIYPLAKFETDFLAEQIAAIGRIEKKFPLVFQHGDPGTWNMLVSPENRVIVIDWEAGEPRGLPLWDLFYFMRTYGSWMSRVQGSKDPLKNFAQNFLTPSALHELLSATLKRYCAGAGLEAEAIAPLFYTCWMHRALKEATRLQTEALAGGTYFNLLRLCIEQRNSAALASLFSLNKNDHFENKSSAGTHREKESAML